MNEEKQHIAVAGLLQVLAVVAGFVMLGIVMKLNGWPEEVFIRWSPVAKGLRLYGVWLLLIPAMWMLITVVIWSYEKGELAFEFAIGFGHIFAVAILLLFLWATINSYSRPLLWSPPGSSAAIRGGSERVMMPSCRTASYHDHRCC